MKETYFSTHEVSRFCNVYPSTVINWINEGALPAFTTPGGHRRIKAEDVVGLMKKNNMPLPSELFQSNKSKVLVIDDDEKLLNLIKMILTVQKGLEVITAKSAFEAGLIISEQKPDIILLDFLMPDIDGFEACRRLRQDEATKHTPIIAVTVLRDEDHLKRMFASGITDHLAKPFKADALIDKISKYSRINK